MAELAEMAKSETQMAEDRMASVERQIHKRIPAGIRRSILCPYCGLWNYAHRELCCDLLRKAVIAVLMADRATKVEKAIGH